MNSQQSVQQSVVVGLKSRMGSGSRHCFYEMWGREMNMRKLSV